MDYDDATPPPIRRASRSAPGQTLILDLYEPVEKLQIEDSDSDDAAPPPIRLQKPTSTAGTSSKSKMTSKPPLPSKNPLRSRTDPQVSAPRSANFSRPNFSHPIRGQPQAQPQLRVANPTPNRKPSRTISYRSNPRLPPTLRRCSSLETIDSVTTTASVEDEGIGDDAPDYPVAEEEQEESPLASPYYLDEVDSTLATPTSLADSFARPSPLFAHQRVEPDFFAKPSPLFSHQRIDSAATTSSTPSESRQYRTPHIHQAARPKPDEYSVGDLQFFLNPHPHSAANEEDDASAHYSIPSERTESLSDRTSTRSMSIASTSRRPSTSTRASTSSVLRRLKPKRVQEPLLTPEHLEIEKTIEFDQHSIRTNSITNSTRTDSSGSVMTISSGRPSEVGAAIPSSSSASQQSRSSSNWKASNFDPTTLSEAELKKCKKKGINPALYAEMKAARKGKFVSPIGGNTFL
jgi:hypothetical protein